MALVKIYKQVNGGGALSTLDIGVTPITGGSVGGVLFEGTGNVLQESANFFWDNTNSRLGIGTATPATTLQIAGTTTTQNILAQTGATYDIGVSATRFRDGWFSRNVQCSSVWAANIAINGTNLTFYNNAVAVLGTLFSTGNLLLSTGTQTDAGYKLDVNGTARIQNNLVIGQAAYIYAQGYNNLFFPFQYSANSVYGAGGTSINNSTPSGTKGVFYDSISFAPAGGTASFASFLATPTINQTAGASGITRGLHINPTLTAAADWRAIEVASGITILGASTTAKASLRIPSGTAPTSPVNGDIWFDGTDIKMRIGGVTKTFTLI